MRNFINLSGTYAHFLWATHRPQILYFVVVFEVEVGVGVGIVGARIEVVAGFVLTDGAYKEARMIEKFGDLIPGVKIMCSISIIVLNVHPGWDCSQGSKEVRAIAPQIVYDPNVSQLRATGEEGGKILL